MSSLGDSKNSPNFPRLIFNSDGDSTTYIAFKPPLTPEQACCDIPVVQGTNRIDIALNRMNDQDCLRIEGIELVIAYL